MTVHSLSFLLAAIICAALAIAILLRGARYRLYSSFSTLNGILCLYFLSSFAYAVSDVPFWMRLGLIAAICIPGSAIHFFTIFLGRMEGIGPKTVRISLTIAALLAPFMLSRLVYEFWVGAIVFGFVAASLVLCLVFIFDRLTRTTSKVESARLKYLLSGGMVALVLSLSDFLPGVELAWLPAIGNMVTVVYMYFLSQIIIQFRLLDLNELVGKMIVLATIVTLLATIYSLVGVFVSNIPGIVFFHTFIAGFVMLILFEPVNRLVEDRVNRLLFRERYEFGRQLSLLKRELANVVDVERMCSLALTRLENSRRVTSASVFLKTDDSPDLRCKGYIGTPPVELLEAVAQRPFLERLRANTALVMESLEAEIQDLVSAGESRAPETEQLRETARILDSVGADVCIALLSDGAVIGVLNVRDERMRDAYSPEEIAHLINIANQCTICVENSRIVTNIRDKDRL
ncbi:MAG: GAF domain-containing protein, partial [Myxococcales bacterium]|nr:GAF domain-containing protein [Myxococcales bacterium]